MKKQKQKDWIWLTGFGLLYAASILLGILKPKATILTVVNYFCLVLCLFYVAIRGRFKSEETKADNQTETKLKIYRNFMLVFAFLAVLISDAILIYNHTSVAGVLFFCFVQIFHLSRTIWNSKLTFILFMLDAVIVTVLWWQGAPLVYIFGFIYGCLILSNLYFSWKKILLNHDAVNLVGPLLTAVGFSLFLLCDICVALSYLSGSAEVLPIYLQRYFDFLAWVFYMPAQVLLAMSVEHK